MNIHTFHFNCKVGPERLSLTNSQLLDYASKIGLQRIAPSRYSWLFALEVMMVEKVYGIDPDLIVSEIKGIEEGRQGYVTKKATPFKRKPLKGLWHKHYFSPRFYAHNILTELPKDKMQKLAEEVFDAKKSDVVTRDMINEFSHRVAVESFEKRNGDNRLTGEWIVFAKHQGKNYYLSLSTHNAGDENTMQKIKDVCCPQFPFLCDTEV